jgi:hypothetical protein
VERADLEALKKPIYDVREQVYAIRSRLSPGPQGPGIEPGLEAQIEQALFEAEYWLDMALHKIDPKLVS